MTWQQAQGIGMTSMRTRRRLVERLCKAGIRHRGVLDAMETVPRHLFVEEALAHSAYEDKALPIGDAQSLSQPWVVARMTEALISHLPPCAKVLEVGTGSGYQACLLAQLVECVYSVERLRSLHSQVERFLRHHGVHNVYLRHADGQLGWPDEAPFEGIMITAATPRVPEALLSQLAEGGRLVVPLGDVDAPAQELVLFIRRGASFERYVLEDVRFVPLLSGKA